MCIVFLQLIILWPVITHVRQCYHYVYIIVIVGNHISVSHRLQHNCVLIIPTGLHQLLSSCVHIYIL